MSKRCTMCKSLNCKCTTQEKILKELISLNKKMEVMIQLTLANGLACANDMAANPSSISTALTVHDHYYEKMTNTFAKMITGRY